MYSAGLVHILKTGGNMSNFKLRDYQERESKKGLSILQQHNILILNFEVRTGKTHIALDIAKHYKRVLFVTKKKAIGSIESDYKTASHSFDIVVINYESLHKVSGKFDLIICDESHCISAFPKPSKRTKQLKAIIKNSPVILLTGTLLPESNSQIYHQLYISKFSPFAKYRNFYAFHKDLGTPKILYTSYGTAKDYSALKYDNIKHLIDPLKLSLTQKEAGFESNVNETILTVQTPELITNLCDRLKNDLVIEGSNEVILADTGVKLMSKLHQLYSGTIKFESGNNTVISAYKARYIADKFKGEKIVIFYKFKAELDAIKTHLDITQDLEEFDNTSKSIALQIVSGREGLNLSKAKYIVYYNIDYSAVSYWQSRDRLTTKERASNDVFWLFSSDGIEADIYEAVQDKKNFTLQTFKKWEKKQSYKKR
jgi:DNA-binding transcriptional regulator YiaG